MILYEYREGKFMDELLHINKLTNEKEANYTFYRLVEAIKYI